MATYISLLRFTQKGAETIKDGPKRLDAATQRFKEAGAEVSSSGLLCPHVPEPSRTGGRRMRTLLCHGILVLTLTLIAPAVAYTGSADEANAVIDQWAAAFTANDADAVVKLYAPNAILLGTVSPEIASDTGAIRSYFARLPGSGNKVIVGERRTIAVADDAVVGAGFYDFTIMREGKPVSSPARFTMVIVKRNGQWLIAHHHSSVRPKPPQ